MDLHVIPAEAGISASPAVINPTEVPAFAGMTGAR
jgi:hypothetical protein